MSILNSKNMVISSIHGCYEGHGYVICVDGGKAAIGNVGHCSCYGTWHYESGEPEGCTEVWSGTVSELVELAKRNADPAMPDRTANPDDYDASELRECYAEVLTKYAR